MKDHTDLLISADFSRPATTVTVQRIDKDYTHPLESAPAYQKTSLITCIGKLLKPMNYECRNDQSLYFLGSHS